MQRLRHHARTLIDWKSGDARADGGYRNRLDSMLLRETKNRVHRRTQRRARRAPTELHARRVQHVTRAQITGSGERRLADSNWTVTVALVLNRWPTRAPDRAGDSGPKHQVVVGRVDDGVDLLPDEVAAHDHDSCFRHSHTSSIRRPTSSRVALAMPRVPIDSMVNEAHATPHTRAS